MALVAVVALSLAVMACSVATVGSPLPSATLNPNQLALLSPSPSPSVEPTRTPVPTALVTPSPLPSLGSASPTAAASVVMPHADPELEAFLPAVLSNTSLTRMSVQGSFFTAGSDMCILICGDEPYRYAKELGVSIDDVTIAFAVSDSLGVGMIAYRARGAKADRLIPARIAIGGYTGHGGLYNLPVSVAGRQATYLDAGMASSGEYLMTRHDVLFIVLGEAPSNGTCHPGRCGSLPPGPWSAPNYVNEAFAGIP
jgi:hypothetical protein